jgi:hypothetical protein
LIIQNRISKPETPDPLDNTVIILLGNVNFDADPADCGLSRLFPFDKSSDDEKSNKTALHNESTKPVSRRVIIVLLDERNRRSKNKIFRKVKHVFSLTIFIDLWSIGFLNEF